MNKKLSWKDLAIDFQHYIKKEMKSRAYIIVTVILCIASIASCFIVDGIVNGQEKEELRIIDKTGIFAGYLVSDSVDEDYFTGVKPVLSDDTSISKEDMLTDIEENGGAYAVFSKDGDDVKLTVYNNGDLSAADQTALINLTQNIYTQMNIGRLGISPEMFEEASRQIGFEEITPAGKPQNFWTTYILFMLMVLAIVMYSSSSGTEVAALKTNKVMEIVMTSIRPLPFYMGVTIAIGLSGLIQLSLVVICFGVSFNISGLDMSSLGEMGITMSAMNFDETAAFLIMFIGGFMLYSFINTAIASIVNKNDDLTTTIVPVEMMAMVQFFICIFALESDSVMMSIFSYIPFTSPSVMFVRYMMGFSSMGELCLSAAILYSTAIVFAVIGSRFFCRGAVHYGTVKEFKFKQG